MASTLLRYYLQRWMLPLLGGVLFFSGLLLANDLVRASRDLFAQGASITWLLPIMLTTLPETFAMVLPMAAILGGLIGTQQLSEGSEMVASQGLGVGIQSLLKPWAILSGMLLLLASLNAHFVVPRISSKASQIESRMIEETKTRFLRPGSAPFFPAKDSHKGVWVAPNGEVHLFEVSSTGVQHLVARNLTWQQDAQGMEKQSAILNMTDLKGCYFQQSNASVGLLDQKTQSLKVDLPSRQRLLPPTPVRYYSTSRLLSAPSPDSWVEISRRVGLPLATVAFLLLGIALGLEHPRFKKGGALIRSLGVILAYYLVMKSTENWYLAGKRTPQALFLPPLLFFGIGISLLAWKMRPHRSNRISLGLLTGRFQTLSICCKSFSHSILSKMVKPPDSSLEPKKPGILGRWTRRIWWKNWGAAMGTLLTLDLLMEYAGLAGDMAKNHVGIYLFLRYWVWNLPEFLTIALPVSFLLGGVMAFSDAAISREWVALRAGGTSLLQWIGAGAKAWIGIVVVTFLLQTMVAPAAVKPATSLRREIRNRPQKVYQTKPWMHLTSTEVLWFLDQGVRWGFPLKSPGEAPILYRWKQNASHAEALPWDGLVFEPGPEASELFPSKALRRSASAEETNTLDLINWQKWAPDPERGTMLWTRLLNWLAGPCLMFAMLAYTFPTPRGGRGQVLGASLVVGLLFLGMQAIFGGAARAGEIPAWWGVTAPLLVLLGFGMYNLHRLKT